MHKSVCLLTIVVGLVLGSGHQSCRSGQDAPAPYALESDCFYQEFTYKGSLEQIKATVVKTELGGYNLSTEQPFLLDTTQYQLLNACNLPEPLKIAGKQVVISGKLYVDTRIIPTYVTIGQPFVLSRVIDLQPI